MLILNRKVDQSIWIGKDIKITLTEIRGNQVRIGIEAPKGVKILREELHAVDKAGVVLPVAQTNVQAAPNRG